MTVGPNEVCILIPAQFLVRRAAFYKIKEV